MRVEITDPEAEERVLKNAAKLQMSPTQFCNFILARISLDFPEEIHVNISTPAPTAPKTPPRKRIDNFAESWRK